MSSNDNNNDMSVGSTISTSLCTDRNRSTMARKIMLSASTMASPYSTPEVPSSARLRGRSPFSPEVPSSARSEFACHRLPFSPEVPSSPCPFPLEMPSRRFRV
ncbi:hypothetical protein MLD38_024061 [Melastoma candidum]|uniref:Uncharacterized protein n=1 Tax=Melastoma candidum TaxID=119954 RepID=A0ACB9NXV4_9MYRT|nr:hypothetical protein MLD38_024061 [Melastoma candidum]